MKEHSSSLVGKKFGKLTVVEATEKRKNGSVVLKCLCDCGNEYEISRDRLVKSKKANCGCGQAESLVGKKFYRLLVLKRAKSKNGKRWGWLCSCDCGNQLYVEGDKLLSGNTKSCGCYSHDLGRERLQKRAINLLGKKYGRLTPVERVYKGGTKRKKQYGVIFLIGITISILKRRGIEIEAKDDFIRKYDLEKPTDRAVQGWN